MDWSTVETDARAFRLERPVFPSTSNVEEPEANQDVPVQYSENQIRLRRNSILTIPVNGEMETISQQTATPVIEESYEDEDIILDLNDGDLSFTERHHLMIDERFEYKREGRDPGLVLIFHHENFQNPEFKYRKGSRRDVNEIIRTLNGLGYNIKKENICSDYTKEKILLTVDTVLQNKDLSQVNCVIVFFLSHGEQDYRIQTLDDEIGAEEIWKKFANCEDLKGKPKLFFFQACRGTDCTFSEYSICGSPAPARLVPSCTFQDGYLAPDMLIVYATLEGTLSARYPEEGAWFIQELCRNFTAYGRREDIISLIIRTTKCVSNIHYVEEDQDVIVKQVPVFLSTLTRKFYLTRSKERSSLIDLKRRMHEIDENLTEFIRRGRELLVQCQKAS